MSQLNPQNNILYNGSVLCMYINHKLYRYDVYRLINTDQKIILLLRLGFCASTAFITLKCNLGKAETKSMKCFHMRYLGGLQRGF